MNNMGVCICASLSTEANGCVTSRLAPGTLPHRRVDSIAPMLVKLDSTISPAKSGCSGRAARSMAMAPPRLCPYTKRRAGSGWRRASSFSPAMASSSALSSEGSRGVDAPKPR
ncbi:hypothetical protein D3C72_1742450 [compost metagenome]